MQKAKALQTIESLSPIRSTGGLSSYEIAAMISIMENCLTPDSSVSPYDVQKDMVKAGYTDLAVSLTLASLRRKEMVGYSESADGFGNPYTVVSLTERGVEWMLENQEQFKLSIEESKQQAPEISDEDIPF